jgi:hypothetical protein
MPDKQDDIRQEKRLAEIQNLEDQMIKFNLHPWDLDDLVHELKSNEAAEINNSGLQTQLRYILEQLGPQEAANQINKLA